jgi:hypothetical protein
MMDRVTLASNKKFHEPAAAATVPSTRGHAPPIFIHTLRRIRFHLPKARKATFVAIIPRGAIAVPTRRARVARLLAAVEVVPLAASAAPVIVRGLRVCQVVGVLGLHVVEARGLVEVRSLGIERRGVLLLGHSTRCQH